MKYPPTKEDLKAENNITFARIAAVIGCTPDLVSEIWGDLRMDTFDDQNDAKDLRKVVKIYGSAAKHTRKVYNLLSDLPKAELERLNISKEQNLLNSAEYLKSLSAELEVIYKHRSLVAKANKSTGGQDQRADALAELVALIFLKMHKSITYGHMEDVPSTDFCRAVSEVLVICDNKRQSSEEFTVHTNWRRPAQKAFKRHRHNTN